MSLVRGVTVLDLIAEVPPGAQGFVPEEVAAFLNLLNVTAVRTRTSERFFVHSGRIQSATDAGLRLGPDFPVEIPGLNAGVPFQLAWIRPEVAPAPDALEGEPAGWILDLFLDRVSVVVPIGRPAELVPTSAVAPAHLRPGRGTRVKLHARGVLRIEGGAGGTSVRLVADPDPIVPTTGIGAVIETGLTPPHLLLHDSGLGLTVDRIVLDLTPHFTPPEIVARGHGPDFEGMSLREATVYLPRNLPFVGDVNFGVRDLIIGWEPSPALQGEARVELGVPLESATGIAFFQQVEGEVVPLGGPSGSGAELTVTVHADTGSRARLFARMATTGVTADWRLPDGSARMAEDSGWFEVSMAPGAPSLRVVERRTAPDDTTSDSQERTFAFVRAAPPEEPQHAPPIRVLYKETGFTHEWDDVVFLRAPGILVDFVQFRQGDPVLSMEEVRALRWQWESDGSTRAGEGGLFEPDVGWSQGTHTVTLMDPHGNVRRCRIEVVGTGDLYVGHRGGGVRRVSGASDTPAPIAAVEASWDLAPFHADDARLGARESAVLEEDGTLTVPRGTLAEVTLGVGTPADPEEPAPATEAPFRHVRVLMAFNVDVPRGWRRIREIEGDPYGPPPPYPPFVGALARTNTTEEAFEATATVQDLVDGLRAWTEGLPDDTLFVVVGRCCDLGPDLHNENLANSRARRGRSLLVSAGVAADRIRAFGEQGIAGADPELAMPTPDDVAELGSRIDPPGRAFLTYYSPDELAAWGKTQEQPERKEGRGVEIYAIVPPGAPTENPEPTDALTRDPARIRALVPGEDADATTPLEAANVRLPYRVEVRAKWDSPSIVEAIDWVPTLAQVTVEWASSAVPVPGLPGGQTVTPTRPGSSTGPDLWRLIGRFTTDVRSGQTSYLLSLDSMGDDDGLFAIVSPGGGRADETVAVALALAPALLGGIDTDDPAGAGVRIAALIAASTAAAAIQIDGEHLVKDGNVIVEKLEGEVRLRAIDAAEGMKIRIAVDYTASFGVQADLSGAVGIHTTQPVQIKYRNVGLEYEHDESRPLLERVRFVFEDAAFEVADPGQWSITGALGRLLGITAIRVGAGSVWFEVDVEFALDLGVVEISRTTIRVDVDTSAPPQVSVSIRGIAAKIDVPGTIQGRGELRVLPDGFGAALELDIIPAKLKAWGAFKVEDPMVHIEGGVRFATGLPLAQTGLGLFGFAGRFVSNGRRNLEALDVDATDIIGREIGWHELGVLDKYRGDPGQFALGFGVYIGTMPDAGFTFNALGMLTIGFPDVSVVFAIDAVLMSGETKSATEQKSAGPASALQLLGIVAVDPEAVGIAIRGRYEIPKTLLLEVPIGAYFPLQSTGVGAYVRVGSDGGGGRPDRPVTIRILPEVLDLRAFSFFMVEEKQLHELGGRPSLSFDGFSVGFGAGLSVQWGGGPIYLKASLTLLVGLGTRPLVLAGGIYVQGELRLVIVGISVSGEIEARITEAGSRLEGEFCGKVSFFFFSIKGCVSFTVGSDPAIPPVDPDPLVTGLVLSDKFSRVVGEGAGTLTGIEPANRAWADGVPTLRFAHGVRPNLSGPGFRPTPSEGWAGLDWSGTNRVRFLYELNAVELVEHPTGGSPQVLDTSDWPAAWWLPAFRNAVPDDGDTAASSHEGWDLALLRWDPSPWSRALSDGGNGIEADPARSLGNVCDPAPRPPRYCVRGEDGQRLDVGRVRIVGGPSGVSPYAPDFRLDLEEGLPPHLGVAELSALAAALGLGFAPGGRTTLPAPFSPPGEADVLAGGWRTPRFTRAGFTLMSLGMRGTFVPEVSEPELLLAVCLEVPDRGGRQEVCVDLAQLRPGQDLGERATIDGVEFADTGQRLRSVDVFPLNAPDGVSELRFTKSLVATLPHEAEGVVVRVGVLEDRAVAIVALDGEGREVGRATAEGQPPGVHELRVEARGIRRVHLVASHGTGHLVALCYVREADLAEAALVERILSLFGAGRRMRLPLPRLIGTDRGGEEEWVGEIVDRSVRGRRGCVFLRYRPRRPGPWTGVRILPYPWFEVSLLRACGIRHGAVVAADRDDAAREELQDAWNDAATGSDIDRYRLLDSDTRYEVRVRYRAATWIGSDPTDNPPDTSGFDFTPSGDITVQDVTQSLFFRTAPAGTLPDDEVLDFESQKIFDPRALARYLRGFDPVAEVPSHFRDDPLLVWFEVEWIEDLLDRHGFDLELVVQRTDPPPTPPSGEAPVIHPPFTVTWSGLPFELRSLADRRMIERATESPCLEDAPVSGAAAQVRAQLEPRARYDLVVRAVALAGGEPVEIGRSHFRASRYRTAGELIEATGFGIERPNPFYPPDLLVDAPPPTGPDLGDDALLDAAISDMGLDPFPPAAGPRSVLLWREVDEGHGPEPRLTGLLLDSDEALLRGPRLVDPTPNPPRLRVLRATVSGVPPLFPSELVPVRSNASATRILLAATSPIAIAVPEDAVLELEVEEPDGVRIGRRSLLTLPLVLAQELP